MAWYYLTPAQPAAALGAWIYATYGPKFPRDYLPKIQGESILGQVNIIYLEGYVFGRVIKYLISKFISHYSLCILAVKMCEVHKCFSHVFIHVNTVCVLQCEFKHDLFIPNFLCYQIKILLIMEKKLSFK